MSIEALEPTDSANFRLVARRNDSLSRKGQRIFFGSLAVASFGMAAVWAAHGAWFVLPFVALEMAMLYAVLRIIGSHAADFESVSIDGDRVLLVRRRRGSESRHEFNRCWARLVVTRTGPGQQYGLAMRSHGKEVSFGELLTDEQRAHVAGELQRRLRTH
ncbi:MAG: DUF2244 domain-containing protein [Burkholderiales bacterium]